MKSMEEYINEVYEKYEETEKNHQKYKTVKVKYHSPLTKLCGVVACVALIVTFFIGVKYYDNNTNEEIKYVSEEKQEDGTVIYTEYIWVDGEFSKILNTLSKYSDYVAIISENYVQKCVAQNINEKVVIKTLGIVKIKQLLKGKIGVEHIQYCKRRWKNVS